MRNVVHKNEIKAVNRLPKVKTIIQPVRPHTYKVSELNGEMLNWAVAKALGMTIYRTKRGEWMTENYGDFNPRLGIPYWNPRLNWLQAGEIIEREGIGLNKRREHYLDEQFWQASYWKQITMHAGPTPLVAAMRCFVASKLGDEIEIPQEAT